MGVNPEREAIDLAAPGRPGAHEIELTMLPFFIDEILEKSPNFDRMKTIQVEVPEDLLISLNLSDSELAQSMRKVYALELFRTGKVTLGQATELSGMDRWNFMEFLGKNKVSIFNYTEDYLRRELAQVE